MGETLHPVEQQDVMAFLDGELSGDQAARTAEHLRDCAECQELAADLQSVSRRMKDWEIAPSDDAIPTALQIALAEREGASARRSWRIRWTARGRAWALVGATAAVLVAVIGITTYNVSRSPGPDLARMNSVSSESPEAAPRHNASPQPDAGQAMAERGAREPLNMVISRPQVAKAPESLRLDAPEITAGPRAIHARTEVAGSASQAQSVLAPMIARTAQVSVVVTDFKGAQSRLDSVLKQHKGYFADMNVTAPEGLARKLTANLRVPAGELDATLADLKNLGRVDSESQSGEEVTAQYVDLQARLKNARNTEQRLTDLLRQRTGKLSDVVEVEEKISEVRESIEQMEAEEKTLTRRVQFASIGVTLAEEHKAQLNVVPPSLGTRIHNAAVEGYQGVTDMFVGLLLFLMAWGPTLLVWAAILFFPVRFAWRRLRRQE